MLEKRKVTSISYIGGGGCTVPCSLNAFQQQSVCLFKQILKHMSKLMNIYQSTVLQGLHSHTFHIANGCLHAKHMKHRARLASGNSLQSFIFLEQYVSEKIIYKIFDIPEQCQENQKEIVKQFWMTCFIESPNNIHWTMDVIELK